MKRTIEATLALSAIFLAALALTILLTSTPPRYALAPTPAPTARCATTTTDDVDGPVMFGTEHNADPLLAPAQ